MTNDLGIVRPVIAPPGPAQHFRHLVSRSGLSRALGVLWLIDGLLQLQPSMFTKTLIKGIMQPVTQGQPGLVANTLQPFINLTSHYIVPINATIALIQLTLGLCLLLGWFVRPVILASIVWSCAVWYAGEGMGMLLTGQASVLTGAPAAVLLYALLGIAAYPRSGAQHQGMRAIEAAVEFAHQHLQRVLAGFWTLACILQVQPVWWRPGQIAQAVGAMESQGASSGNIIDTSLRWFARGASGAEIVVNLGFIVAALSLAVGLAALPKEHVRPLLVSSMVLSTLMWWSTQGFGQILSGTATDVNSGPLLVLFALACWPVTERDTRSSSTRRGRALLLSPFHLSAPRALLAGVHHRRKAA